MAPRSRIPIKDEDLLEAGWTIVQQELGWQSGVFVAEEDLAASTMLSSIRARDVIAKANVSPGSFYRRWDNIGDYLSDLSIFILKRKRHEYEYLAIAFDAFEQSAASGRSITQIVRDVTAVDLASTSGSIEFGIQMYLWSLCRRYRSIRELLADQYADIDAAWEKKYSTTLGLLGLRLRPDVTTSDLTALITGLAEGLAIRRVVDQDVVSEELLAAGVMALLAAAVDWDDDAMSLETWLASRSSR